MGTTHQDKSLETFNDRLREVATELHDTGGHYLLNDEQLAAITAAAQKYADEQYVVAEIKTLESYVDLYARANPPLTVEAIRTQLKGHIEMAKQALAALRKGAS